MLKLKLIIFAAIALFTVALAQVTLLAQSDFSSQDGLFRNFKNEGGEGAYESGAYRITISKNNWISWYLPTVRYGNVRVRVDMAKINPVATDGGGLVCRYNDGDYYLFWLDSEGSTVAIFRAFQREWTTLVRKQIPSEVTLYKNNRYNTLAIDCNGKDLIMYLNGKVVASAQDDDLTLGRTGIWLEKYNYIGTSTAYFDNFYIWALGN